MSELKLTETSVVYNLADEQETNVDILRAEILAVETPVSRHYTSYVYQSLKTIQTTCAYDFKTYCAGGDFPTQSQILINKNKISGVPKVIEQQNDASGIISAFNEQDGRKLINSLQNLFPLKSLVRPVDRAIKSEVRSSNELTPTSNLYDAKPGKTFPVLLPPNDVKMSTNDNQNVKKSSNTGRKLFSRKLGSSDSGSDSGSDSDSDEKKSPRSIKPKPKPSPKAKMDPKAPPKSMGPAFPAAPLKDGGMTNEFDNATPPVAPGDKKEPCPPGERDHHGGPHEGPHGIPPPPPPPVDDIFVGAIGYGAASDACMYQNYQQLSVPCQQSIVSLYKVRSEYWAASQAPPPPPPHDFHHHFSLLPWIYFFLIAVGLRKVVYGHKCGEHRQRREKVVKVLETIKANPALRAAVESEAGVEIPDLPAMGCKGRGKCGGCLKKFLFVVFHAAIVFLIGISSLIFTGMMLHSLVSPPSPFFALFVLFGIVAAEIFLFKKLVSFFWQPQPPSGSSSSAAVTGEQRRGLDGQGGLFARFMVPLQSLNVFGLHQGTRSPSYSPLMAAEDSDERNDTEMTAVANVGQPVYIQQQPHGGPSAYAAYPGVIVQGAFQGANNVVPTTTIVSASPMTAVRMV